MSNLQDISKDKRCRFIPHLVDIITPELTEYSKIESVFLIMEFEEVDLRVFMQKG